jgi:hypothetical protein
VNIKRKLVLVLVLIVVALIVAVSLFASRWIGQMLIGSVDQLQAAGEAPLPTEETWIAPTIAPEVDFAAQEEKALDNMPDPEPTPTEEAEASAPILESPEQLAGTADQTSIVDANPSDN